MKRLFAFLLALALVLSLNITAFAAEDTGSITITNATVGQTYAPYKIFDASISGGEDGGFTYSIEENNQFFATMFLDTTNPEEPKLKENKFFTYDSTTGAVAKRATVTNADVLVYLKSLIYMEAQEDTNGDGTMETVLKVKPGLTPEKTAIVAGASEVQFTDLPYGYYLITSSLGTLVTINSTDPDVRVIDKNQKPGEDFSKKVLDEDIGTKGEWVGNSSANIGDIVDFKVAFDATNYNGEDQIKHYIVGDNKGNALWVEFNSIKVTVNGTSVGKGWYHCTDHDTELNLNTNEWTSAVKPEQWAASANEAGWYLIHNGYDDFDIIIPWLNGHTFTPNGENYTLAYPQTNPTSKFTSPAEVVIQYKASVEANADIDGATNLYNTADLSWMDETLITHPETPTTHLTVHALGVTKIDGDTDDLLAGAVFEIFEDQGCTKPVFVIPTNVEGVYILDDLDTIVSGENRETSRKKYAAYLDAYLDGARQKNEVVTQLNGKLVVLGLEKGTYYLKEKEAPSGYNKLASAVAIEIDGNTETYTFSTNDQGKVVETDKATQTHTYKKVEGKTIENNKGIELPSTGGEGAMRMITFGSIVAMVFAVLLITHKKMSVYHD